MLEEVNFLAFQRLIKPLISNVGLVLKHFVKMQISFKLILSCAALCWTCVAGSITKQHAHQNVSRNPLHDVRDGKFLGFFNLAINNNQACRALNGDIGTCLSYAECLTFRGSVSGTCGSGFGLCCLNSKTCQGVIYGNNTYFVNQGYPSSYSSSGQCSVTINRLTPNICQLRLDFEVFSIAQPEMSEHRCVTDSFVVSGTTSPVPVICGDNTGQHMYLNIGYDTKDPVILTMVTSNLATSLSALNRNWKIRVTQLPCNEGFIAPPGCLQYFIGSVGVIKSFNFFFDAGSTTSARQLSNQDYTICIRQEAGNCGIGYEVCSDPVNNPGHGFTLTGSYDSTSAKTASFTDSACSKDYLLIPCATNVPDRFVNSDDSVCAMRMCGGVFNSVNAQTRARPVYSSSIPYQLRFHTNGQEASDGDQGNLGFCLQYQQSQCSPSANNILLV